MAGELSRAGWTGPRREGVQLDLPRSHLGLGSDLSLQGLHLLLALLPQLNLCSLSWPHCSRFSVVKPLGPGVGRVLAPLPRPAPWASASPSLSPVSLVLTAGVTRSHHDFRQIHTHQVQLFMSALC